MATNTSDSTTSSKPKEPGFLACAGMCFKVPVVATARGAKTTLVLIDSAATALEEEETRLKKLTKNVIHEGINTANMVVLGVNRMNLEIAASLDVDLDDDLDEMLRKQKENFKNKKNNK